MELKFTRKDGVWVSEFEASADFNLHIEGVLDGNVKVFQRGTPAGEYAFVRGATPYPAYDKVYDMDFAALVYPKYIKVTCETEPTYAEMTEAENFGGGSAGASTILFTIDGVQMSAQSGMTLEQWCNSEYNIDGWHCGGPESQVTLDVVIGETDWDYSEWKVLAVDGTWETTVLGQVVITDGAVYNSYTDSSGIGGGM